MFVSPNGLLARSDGTFLPWQKMKHKHNISQVRAHANACFVMWGYFILTPKPRLACSLVSTIELEIIIGSAPLLCNHDH